MISCLKEITPAELSTKVSVLDRYYALLSFVFIAITRCLFNVNCIKFVKARAFELIYNTNKNSILYAKLL